MLRSGDLVRGKKSFAYDLACRSILGIIICEADKVVAWEGAEYKWWKVLCEDGHIVVEYEKNIEVISEDR